MKRIFTTLVVAAIAMTSAFAQIQFDPEVEMEWVPEKVTMPPSPLKMQVLFIGGHHEVQTVDNNGNPNGTAIAKQWHDFLGFTPDENSDDLGWVSVNHERIQADDKIGDGGGMTVFKIKRDEDADTLVVVEQTLSDGRSGEFFNVDFVNTVGETGMNCGGIVSVDGRIWTAEEWFRTSTANIYYGGAGVRDTMAFTIDTDIDGDFDGKTIQKYENFNYMVEIDPKEAVAIRKQYNWGRQPFEGGAIAEDNKTVYLGADATPGFFSKFVADEAGDFTSGKLYVYKQDDNAFTGSWVEIDNSKLDNMLNFADRAIDVNATMFNRIEWVTLNQTDGKIYFTETGRDNPAGRWIGESQAGAAHAKHTMDRASEQGTHPDSADYADYYGRVMVYDPSDNSVKTYLEGGAGSTQGGGYPDKFLSNPDGLSVAYIGDKTYFIVQEDLNGTSQGRVKAGVSNRTCEIFLLDADDEPIVDNLIRIGVVPVGAEVTGAIATPDGKSILFNSQHPSGDNPFPFNNSLTVAISGWDKLDPTTINEVEFDNKEEFSIYPNPTSRELYLNKVTDVAIYSMEGQRMKVYRNTKVIDVRDLKPGTYVVRTIDGENKRLIVQ